ncbi:hypothetical protein DB774_24385, partial [Xanthomonas perforans]
MRDVAGLVAAHWMVAELAQAITPKMHALAKRAARDARSRFRSRITRRLLHARTHSPDCAEAPLQRHTPACAGVRARRRTALRSTAAST